MQSKIIKMTTNTSDIKKKETKRGMTLRFKEDIREMIYELAESENRSITNWIETLVLEQWEEYKKKEK
jgi:hypothetical protein